MVNPLQEKMALICAQRKEENYQAYIKEVGDECLAVCNLQ